MILSWKRPIDLLAIAFAVALALIAFAQWRASKGFVAGAVQTTGTVTEIRIGTRVLLDAQTDSFATVEFTSGSDETMTAELPTPIRTLGLQPENLVGTVIPLRYDPEDPRRVRYGNSKGSEGAAILAALALGALLIPFALRKSAMASVGGG